MPPGQAGDGWEGRWATSREGSGPPRAPSPNASPSSTRPNGRGPRASCSPAPTSSCTRCASGACRTDDPVATLTANRAELLQALLAIFQAGWQYVPLNTHLTADEVAYILDDSGAAALIADARYADVAGVGSGDRRRPGGGADLDRAPSPASPRWPTLLAGQPDHTPDDRVAGQFMQYTSGTTGRPKAVQRDLPQFDPETWVAALQRQPHPLRHRARWRRGPPGDVADVPPVAARRSATSRCTSSTPSCSWTKWDAERALQLIERYRVTDVAMVPTQLHRLMQLPDDVRAAVRRVVVAPGHPCRGAVPGRPEAAVVRLAGPGDLRVLRRDAKAAARSPSRRTGSRTRARSARPWVGADVKILDDDGNELPPGTVGTVYLKLMGEFAYKGDPDEDRGQPARRLLHRRRHGRARRRRLPVPARPQDRHDHLRRREHLPRRGRGRAARRTPRSATPRCSGSRTTTGAKR